MEDIISVIKDLKGRVVEMTAQLEFLSKSPAHQLNRKYLDADAVCKILKVSPRTLAKMRNEGAIKFSKIRRRVVFKAADVYRFIEKGFGKKIRIDDRRKLNPETLKP